MQTTPIDALFLTPPDIETMRLNGRRAIVVDWKSGPQAPAEILQWWQRLQDVTGRVNLGSERDLMVYDSLDAGRLKLLRDRYKIDYAVVRRGHEQALSAYRRCYENQTFVVVEVTPRG